MNKFNLLFPGRHHLLTNYQEKYLKSLMGKKISDIADIIKGDNSISGEGYIDNIIFAITSSDHQNTKRNPLSGSRREVAINNFAQDIKNFLVYHIDDIGKSDHFANYMIKKISVESDGHINITPDNTIIATSTDNIIHSFLDMGYYVLSVEYDFQLKKYLEPTPWQILDQITTDISNDINPQLNKENTSLIHTSTLEMYDKYNYRERLNLIYKDKILLQDGDITATRDYNTYSRSFEDGSDRKYDYIKENIKGGNIVDIGCCTGGLIGQIAQDDSFHESDVYGVDIVTKFIETCKYKKSQGAFANENIFFLQRNIIDDKVFKDNFLDTAITFALTHEIISYDSLEKLDKFVANLYSQINLGGRWINFDVVGPDNKEDVIIAYLNSKDGKEFKLEEFEKIFSAITRGPDYALHKDTRKSYISSLSTYGKFILFTKTFRYKQQDRVCKYEEIGDSKVKVRFGDLTEFLSKKDYIDNWLSEMNEYFCTLNFEDWKNLAIKHGFKIHPSTCLIYNEWIYKNRYVNTVELFTLDNKMLSYPPTNIKLILEK